MNTISSLKTATELSSNKPHGTRLKYLGGCRCVPCRAANSRYSVFRSKLNKQGKSNPIIDANNVKQRLALLSQHGIGLRSVADITDISRSVLQKIKNGERLGIRKQNAQKVLNIEPTAIIHGNQIISAKTTWKQIRWLLSEGFTQGALAKRLGYKTPNLQINKKNIKTATALKVEKLYNQMRLGE